MAIKSFFRTLTIIISFLLINVSPVSSSEPHFFTKAKYAILIDYSSNSTLFVKNADEKMVPSSMSKLMTLYIAFKNLKEGRIKLDDKFSVSEKAWKMGGSRTFLDLRKGVVVEDLIRGVIVHSGNDASVALAEGIAGDEEFFVQQMNSEAKRLGLANSYFENSTGWPTPKQRMSSRDIATLSSAIVKNFPEYYHFFAEKSFTYNKIKQQNRNISLGKGGIDGLKTGSTEEGGYGIAISAERDGKRLIAVVNGLKTQSERAVEAERLLNYGFNGFQMWTVFSSGQKIQEIPVIGGEEKKIEIFADADIKVLLPKFANKDDLSFSVQYQEGLVAPITKGQKIAHLVIQYKENILKKRNLFASSDMKEAGWFKKIWHLIAS